ncbi:hypothetical protein CEV34_0823 [Brucella pseudogrignonensis]|uniref:Uncharacterized protein n=1 Tax=Brucella pseudogrignonensis TaxID=419475 RepID=A0A256GPZ3_9HYPH|nr:hypothetical protein CEV34_0823 [Brucella pseudogrignonensis]
MELLRSLWHPLSYVSDDDCRQTMKLWLMEGNYDLNNSPPNASIYCHDKNDVKKCLSLDAFKFASHAAQTVYELEKTSAFTKLTSWRLIQVYYAAYFSAHSTLRYFGRSFSHLEGGHVRFIKDRCSSEVGYLPKLPSSYYLIKFSPDKQEISLEVQDESHKDLWSCYRTLLQELSSDALKLRASENRRLKLSNMFSDIENSISNNGKNPSGNWLSTVRNEANYKSLQGVWFPFTKETPIFRELMEKVKNWRKLSLEIESPNLAKNELERFFLTAFSVIDIGISITSDYKSLIKKPDRRSKGYNHLLQSSAA